MPRRVRDAYEKHPSLAVPLPEPLVEQAAIGPFELPASRWLHAHDNTLTAGSRIVLFYSTLIYFLEVILMFGAYSIPTGIYFAGLPFSAGFQFLYPKEITFTETGDVIPDSGEQLNPSNDSYFAYNAGVVSILMWAQMSLFSLGHVHFMVRRYNSSTRSSDLTRNARRAVLIARILACVGFDILGCLIAIELTETKMFESLSLHRYIFFVLDSSELGDCLMQVNRNASCVNNAGLSHSPRNGTQDLRATNWATSETYGPWGAGFNTPGWSNEPSSEHFHGIHGL